MVARRNPIVKLTPSSTGYKWSADSTSAMALRKNNHGTYNANRCHQGHLRKVWQQKQRILTINSSSNRIHLAKYLNKPTSPATELLVAQMQDFATQQKMVQIFCRPSPSNFVFGVHSNCCLFYNSSNLRYMPRQRRTLSNRSICAGSFCQLPVSTM